LPKSRRKRQPDAEYPWLARKVLRGGVKALRAVLPDEGCRAQDRSLSSIRQFGSLGAAAMLAGGSSHLALFGSVAIVLSREAASLKLARRLRSHVQSAGRGTVVNVSSIASITSPLPVRRRLKTLIRLLTFLLPPASLGCKNDRGDNPPPARREPRIDAPGEDVSVEQDRGRLRIQEPGERELATDVERSMSAVNRRIESGNAAFAVDIKRSRVISQE
jgi:hypothetical protein